MPPTKDRGDRERTSGRTTTRSLLVAAALGVGVGVALLPVLYAITTVGAAVPFVAGFSFGLWLLAALLPLAVVRRPGSGVIGAAAAGAVASASPAGVLILVMLALLGALVELPFLLTRYRSFGLPMLMASALGFGALSCALSIATYELPRLQPWLAVTVCLGQLGSAAIGALLAWRIARALRLAGVGPRPSGD